MPAQLTHMQIALASRPEACGVCNEEQVCELLFWPCAVFPGQSAIPGMVLHPGKQPQAAVPQLELMCFCTLTHICFRARG